MLRIRSVEEDGKEVSELEDGKEVSESVAATSDGRNRCCKKWNTDRGELSKDYDDEDAKMPEKVWKEVRVK